MTTPRDPAALPLRLVASWFLVGERAPFAPATFACLAFLPVAALYLFLPLAAQVAITLLVTAVSIPVSTRAERLYGHDGGPIVIDEVVGMLVTFLGVVPGPGWGERMLLLGAGFLFFRITDILKPFPAGRAQHLPTGTGVVMDDFIAGIYANFLLRLVQAVS